MPVKVSTPYRPIVSSFVILTVLTTLLVATAPRPASALADEIPPVAIIEPLPEQVSNGTWVAVNGSGSYDLGGVIVNRTWEIEHAGTIHYEYGCSEFPFKFKELGLYTIKFTVTDSGNHSDVDFTAVYSILDSDFDGLPDWWEDYYFKNLDQGGQGDPDEDGYTNLQEYADGTDPEVKDPAPAGILEKYWLYFAAAAAVAGAAVLLMMPRRKRKRKQDEDAKIQAALEIEKALETED